ncbi:MAG: hypothetical protein WCT31_01855 [Candidatus Micrarchaeia archaeon]|jgi:hypothetical protein
MEKKNLDFCTVEPCASSNAFEIKFKSGKIDLNRVALGEVLAKTPAVLICKFEGKGISIYASGRIMIKGINKQEADKFSEEIVSSLRASGALE